MSHIYHLLIALWLTSVVTFVFYLLELPNGLLVGTLMSVALFYGREHSQEERKLADSLYMEHKDLFIYCFIDAVRLLNPFSWTSHNRLGFFVPTIGVVVFMFVLKGLGY